MADIYSVVSKYVSLHKHGREYIGVCPFHEEKYPSFKVNVEKNIFKCFGCGKGGSPYMFIKLYNEKNNTNHRIDNTAEPIKPKQEFKDKIDDWKIIAPVPVWVEQPSFRHFNYGVPNDMWRYTNEKGLTMFYVCRFNMPDGSKEVLPFSYCTNGKQRKWMWKGMKDKRPVDNLKAIANNNDPIVIVEGEKTADAGIKNSDIFRFVTFQGGSNGYQLTDYTPLQGKTVVILRDNDDPGIKCMDGIKTIIQPICKAIYEVGNMDDMPKKWDIADTKWKKGELDNFIKTRIRR